MTSTEIQILCWAGGILVTVLIALIGWIGSGMVTQLKNIATSVNKIEVEIGVLSNDHANLKDEVKEIKERVLVLER